MWVLVTKNKKICKPIHYKSRIVVLGDFEDRLYQNPQHYASVLKYRCLSILTSKSVGDKHILQQDDFKNAFCNATLLDDEVTVIRPPIGDPDFQEDEYWLLKKNFIAYVNPPIIGTTRSKRFCWRWASISHPMTPSSFPVYFPTPTLLIILYCL